MEIDCDLEIAIMRSPGEFGAKVSVVSGSNMCFRILAILGTSFVNLFEWKSFRQCMSIVGSGFSREIVMSAFYLNLSRFALVVGFVLQVVGAAHALPALQLGPDGSVDWTYDNTTQTWVWTGTGTATLNAYANATTADGGNGYYAWDPAGSIDQTAYLVFSAVPDVGDIGDVFDISVSGDGGPLTLVDSGYGNPPLNDPNSLAPHGIFPTYYEIYGFSFDDALTLISDTQPGETGTGMGYVEAIDILINSLLAGVSQVHVDLFTIIGDGIWDPYISADRQLVNAFAPFSHDATIVPLPAALPLFAGGLGLMGLLGWRRKRMTA